MSHPLQDRATRLFVVLTGLFITNALIAEFVGVKIFALEDTLGIAPLEWRLFGQSGSLSFTAGVLLWPVVFVMTDVINEFFGPRGVRFISWLAVALILHGFLFAYLAIGLAPAGWWVGIGSAQGVPDMQAAFAATFGQGLWTIAGSVTAFLFGQLIDVAVFQPSPRSAGGNGDGAFALPAGRHHPPIPDAAKGCCGATGHHRSSATVLPFVRPKPPFVVSTALNSS